MIRSFRESDVEAVALLFTEAVHQLTGECYDAAQRAAWAPRPPDLEPWVERLGALHTLVAETDRHLDGFISYKMNGHIDLLYTSPACSRRGVAAALYREVEETLASSGIAELCTEASMIARPFFERRGFSVIEAQDVQRRGVTLRRYAMRKQLAARKSDL